MESSSRWTRAYGEIFSFTSAPSIGGGVGGGGTAGGINVEANLLSPGGRGPRASFMTPPTLLFAVPVCKI